MKTLFLNIILLLGLPLGASVNPIDLIVQADPTSRTLTVRMTTGVERPTTVRIVDRAGLVLHTTKLDSGEYLNTRFKLSALPIGTYDVEVSDRFGKTTQPLVIDAQGITADPGMATRTNFPHVKLKEKLLTVNYLNTSGRGVTIRIVDTKGNEVLEDRIKGTASVNKAYSLERLPAGDYSVTVNATDIPAHTTSLALK